MQFAFRVQTDAAILGAGFVLAGGADAYPAPPATPRHHPKLTASFSPKGTKCEPAVRLVLPEQNDSLDVRRLRASLPYNHPDIRRVGMVCFPEP
jgi:hypothetical protein